MAGLESCTLLIRHLPSALSRDEKEDLIRHFGAQRVKVMGHKGPMKHTAFATFPDADRAKQTLDVLHQMEILDCKLVVEFARKPQQKHFPSLQDTPSVQKEKVKETTENDEANEEEKKFSDESVINMLPSVDRTLTKWSIDYPRNPDLYYVYPPPTATILTNIAHTIAAHPKLYVQSQVMLLVNGLLVPEGITSLVVLHLMNKMNLPAPFGPVTPVPPLPTGAPPEDEVSTEESEIDSEGESHRVVLDEQFTKKRKASTRSRKRLKVPRLMTEPAPKIPEKQGPVITAEEAFEQAASQQITKKIQLKIPDNVVTEDPQTSKPDKEDNSSDRIQEEAVGGFGKLEPAEKPKTDGEVMTESELLYKFISSQLTSLETLQQNRVTDSELRNFSVFKRYSPGEATTRLYIKNLAKPTTEQDLMNIYGNFIDWTLESGRNIFDIRLMKEGRMKGQAFVTFPTEESAKQALRESNAYVLHGKPMVVQFARSAKAKVDEG